MLPVYNPVDHVPPPVDLFPTLRLVQDPSSPTTYRTYLSRALAEQLHLSPNQPIDLLPPSANHSYWHLDLRAQAKNRLNWYTSTGPRIQRLLLSGTVLGEGVTSLTLRLVPGEPAFPGFYPLLPDAYFAPHQAQAVAASAR